MLTPLQGYSCCSVDLTEYPTLCKSSYWSSPQIVWVFKPFRGKNIPLFKAILWVTVNSSVESICFTAHDALQILLAHATSTVHRCVFSKQVTCCLKHGEANCMGLETKPKLTEMQIFPWNNRIYQTERRKQDFKNSFCLSPLIIDNKLLQWQAYRETCRPHLWKLAGSFLCWVSEQSIRACGTANVSGGWVKPFLPER